MTCRACVKLPLYGNGIDCSIYSQIINRTHNILVRLLDFGNDRTSDVGILKKERGDVFSERQTEIFKARLLQYINGVLF